MLRRQLAFALAMACSTVARAESAPPDDAIRWRTRLVAEHRDFAGVWVDTRELEVGRSLRDVTAEVSCLDASAAPIRSETFLVTDGVRPELSRGVVHLRYFRHTCPAAHKIVGVALRYTESGTGASPVSGRTATLRSDRIRVPSRQVELIGASPFHTTDPSAYCVTPLGEGAKANVTTPTKP
jgi:hypothetical protein